MIFEVKFAISLSYLIKFVDFISIATKEHACMTGGQLSYGINVVSFTENVLYKQSVNSNFFYH